MGEGGWGAHPLHPTPRSAPVCGFKNVLIRVDGAWVACVAADPRNVYTIGSVYTLYTGDLECLRRRRLGLSWGAFHLSELTGKTSIPVAMGISLLIKTLQPDQSNPK